MKVEGLQLKFVLKWLFVVVFVGVLSGSASAIFLLGLQWAKNTREAFPLLLLGLPLGGFAVALAYKKLSPREEQGNNLVIEEVQTPNKLISFLMAPLVLAGTIITHVFGGSAGREGTAVQMGSSIADQLSNWINFSASERKVLLQCGIAAGFASVFGTPFAGAIFAIEIIFIGKLKLKALIPALLAALLATYICDLWPIEHTHYFITEMPEINVSTFGWVLFSSLLFGVAGMVFSRGMFSLSGLFKKYISNSLLRPVIGGLLVVIIIYFAGLKYAGLGVDVIVDAFTTQQGVEVFALKLLLTVLTLSAGFKGGEVTPLFFIGATLGSALTLFVPLPLSFLAGLGFVAVFAAATNAPIACAVMGFELFGLEAAGFITLACFVAYYFSGHTGIYSAQIIGRPKHIFLPNLIGKRLRDLM